MLYTRTLKANQWDTISVRGKHINLVLAAGVIQMSLMSVEGQTYNSNIVSGMSPENMPEFQSVSFKSTTAQTIQYWASNYPLTYAPDTSRQVGSNSLRSTVGQVFSGVPTQLLPSEVGRNKITLSPSEDIFIGGTNLDTENGVKLTAGSTFTLATQGAVYALETSGDYPAEYTTEPTEENILNPTLLEDTSIYHFFQSSTGKTWASTAGVQTSSLTEYVTDDLPALTTVQIVSLGYTLQQDYLIRDGDMLYTLYVTGGTTTHFCTFNLQNGVKTDEIITDGGANIICYQMDKRGDTFITFENSSKTLVMSTDGGVTWAKVGVACSNTTNSKGLALFDNGDILVCCGGESWFTDDNGATWTEVANAGNPSGASYPFLRRAGGTVYVRGTSGNLYVTYDKGVSWQTACEPLFGSAQSFDVSGDTIVVGTNAGYAIKSPLSDGENEAGFTDRETNFVSSNSYCSAITQDGKILIQIDKNSGSGNTVFIDGNKVPLGGLSVAILEEIN